MLHIRCFISNKNRTNITKPEISSNASVQTFLIFCPWDYFLKNYLYIILLFQQKLKSTNKTLRGVCKCLTRSKMSLKTKPSEYSLKKITNARYKSSRGKVTLTVHEISAKSAFNVCSLRKSSHDTRSDIIPSKGMQPLQLTCTETRFGEKFERLLPKRYL